MRTTYAYYVLTNIRARFISKWIKEHSQYVHPLIQYLRSSILARDNNQRTFVVNISNIIFIQYSLRGRYVFDFSTLEKGFDSHKRANRLIKLLNTNYIIMSGEFRVLV